MLAVLQTCILSRAFSFSPAPIVVITERGAPHHFRAEKSPLTAERSDAP